MPDDAKRANYSINAFRRANLVHSTQNEENTNHAIEDQDHLGCPIGPRSGIGIGITINHVERMTVSPDQAWSVAGPTPPLKPPAAGTVPDPLSDTMKAGRWNQQAEDAQKDLVDAFRKKYDMK